MICQACYNSFMTTRIIKQQLATLPKTPGVYRFYDSKNKLLYIGKAKRLNYRVKSYFQKSRNLTPTKHLLVEQISKIEYTLVNSEIEAIILESTLIKKFQPPFNIDLKDDKNWQYFKVHLQEIFPRVEVVRQILNDKAKYFGPYTSGWQVKQLWKFIRKTFSFRTCERDLSNLPNGRVCLLYQLGQCLGPCENKTTLAEYDLMIKRLLSFLKGQTKDFEKKLLLKMKRASLTKDYKQAAKYRDQIQSLKQLYLRQDVALASNLSADFFNYTYNESMTAISWLKIRQGLLLNEENFYFKNKFPLKPEDLLSDLLERITDLGPNIFGPKKISGLKIIVPKIGQKKRLLDLAKKNAKNYLDKNLTSWQKDQISNHNAELELKKILKLEVLNRLEAYDISNLGSKYTVGAMTVAINGKIDKGQYRKFKIKTISSQNDPGMIAEVVSRRLEHLEWQLPELILIDGGPTQLQAAYKVLLEKNLDKQIYLISLAKKRELIFTTKQKHPLKLPLHNSGLKLLQRLRDEAHRFGITYHRSLRKKADFS